MKLTIQAVEKIILECLFKKGEDPTNRVEAAGVLRTFGFHPGRLEFNRAAIKELLDELPEQFQQDKGGGWSFLNACMDKDRNQWGQHRDIESLLALGIATKQAKILLPKELWSALPGGMPYFAVGDFATSSQTAGAVE
jgi:hypothetical protein